MTGPSAPLRFIMLVLGGWVGVRALTLVPYGIEAAEVTARAEPMRPREAVPTAVTGIPHDADWSRQTEPGAVSQRAGPLFAPVRTAPLLLPAARSQPALLPAPVPVPSPEDGSRAHVFTLPAHAALAVASGAPIATRAAPPAFEPPPATARSRWAGSAWAFIRNELGGSPLAPGGSLGGSQAGARLTYRVNSDSRRPLSLSARLYAPLENLRGAEGAFGVDWRPIAGLPVNILAERRQAIGRDGRSDFALMLHGGGETSLLDRRLRISGYGQAGIVGIESRDLFADGGVTATTRIGPVELGGGVWGGAQPGIARLDVGPHASFRLPVGGVVLRAATEWRFRVAGDATPGSGPTLTLSAGF